MAQSQATRFGSLEHYDKGGVEVINDNAKNYVFSNVFEVASQGQALREDRGRQEHRVRDRGDPRRGDVRLAGGRAGRVRARHGR